MTIAQLGIDIKSDSARLAATTLDKLVPAAQRAEKAVDQMAGSISQDLRGVEATAGRMSASVAQDMRAVESSAQSVGKGFAVLGSGNIQNVAFQLQDFAVQVGAGTSASTALAQQLPQLLGGFGTLGAVLGAVAAIGIPLTAALVGSADGAQSLSERSDDLSKSSERLASTLDALSQTNRELRETYGANADAMREILQIQAGIATADFGEKMRAQATAAAEAFGSLQTMINTPSRDASGVSPTELVVRNIADALRTTEAEAAVVLQRMNELGSASTVEDQARASLELARAMADAAGGAENLTGAALEMYRALTDAASAGFSAASALDAAGRSANTAASEIRSTTAAYYEFQQSMRLATEAQAAMDAQAERSSRAAYAEYQQSRRLGEEADARARSAELGATEDGRTSTARGVVVTGQDRVAIDRAALSRARAAKSAAGGGGGGKSDAEKEAERQNRELDKLDKALDRVNEGLALEAAMIGQSDVARRVANLTRQASIKIGSDEYESIQRQVQAIDAATRQYERLQEVQDYVAQTGADLFTSAISGADSFADALRGVAAELGQMLANQAFIQLVGGGKNNAPGMAGGIFGALLGGLGRFGKAPATGIFAGGFAPAVYGNGTDFHPGGPAIVNDRGGEIINLPRGSQVIPHDISREMARGGQQEVDVRVSVDNEGGIRAYVNKQTTKAEKRAVQGSVNTIRKGDASSRHFWKR